MKQTSLRTKRHEAFIKRRVNCDEERTNITKGLKIRHKLLELLTANGWLSGIKSYSQGSRGVNAIYYLLMICDVFNNLFFKNNSTETILFNLNYIFKCIMM